MHNRREGMKLIGAGLLSAIGQSSLAASPPTPAPSTGVRLGLIVKTLGTLVYDAVRDGGLEAAKEFDNVELIYAGPVKGTAQEQIELVETMVAQRVQGIMISAVDANALLPACKKALLRGVRVVSFEAPVAPGGRLFHLDPCDAASVGVRGLQLIAETLNDEGEVAVLSPASGQGRLRQMKEEWVKAKYARLKLVDVAETTDTTETNLNTARDLIAKHSKLGGIIGLTPTATAAAATASGATGGAAKVLVSGIGFPSELQASEQAGVIDTFATWNPVDLGYCVTHMLAQIVIGKVTDTKDTSIQAGRIGEVKLGHDGTAVLGDLIVIDKTNIERYAKLF
jgi:rhamnose transport system substrate-binding protein